MISNIKAEKIEGPKILGKIELPVQGENKPGPNDEKRQRKRIPIARKDVPVQRNEPFKKREGDRPQITPNTGGNFRPRTQGGGHGSHARPGSRPSFISREAIRLSYQGKPRRSIKKKFRIRSVKPRQSLRVQGEEARASKQNTGAPNAMNWPIRPAEMSCRTTSCS